jgi:drug/metabolite transporter (DMT)-like permease
MRNAGEFAALITAMCWTVTALAFEASSRKVGSMVVNLLRLIAGFIFLSIFCLIYRGSLLPVDASGRTWFILVISGLIGFTFGDLCLFQAFVIVGARISMLLMALAPPITAFIGWLFLGETMTIKSIAGMALTLTGIAIVVLKRPAVFDEDEPVKKKVRFSYPIWGILLGLGGAFGQATGLVLSKYGMHGYDPFASAQIRVIAGIGGFVVIYTFWNVWKTAYKALSNSAAMVQLSVGAFFGPFLGVSFSLLAVQLTGTGIASTIMAMVPVLIIPPSMIIFREKVTFKEVLGAVLAVGGVALFFL